jgi:cytochrome b561
MAMQKEGYSTAAVIIHWLMAISILFLFGMSWWMMAQPFGTFREAPFQLHKNLGITLVIVLALLLYVRFRHPPAAQISEDYPRWMHQLAVVDHVLLYLLIFAVCISGYLSSSFSGWGTTFWGVIEFPDWGWEDEELNIFFSDIHLWTCWALLALLAVHISGALFHAFRRDAVVRRMLHL